jgi:hypothetical protein
MKAVKEKMEDEDAIEIIFCRNSVGRPQVAFQFRTLISKTHVTIL